LTRCSVSLCDTAFRAAGMDPSHFTLAPFGVLANAYIFMQYIKTTSSVKVYIAGNRPGWGFFQMMRRTTALFARNSDYKMGVV
jgi:hypothetical protein